MNKLDTTNPNRITYRFEELDFELLGGVNTESFQSLRVMLVVKYKRVVVREQVDLYNSTILNAFIRKVVTQTSLGVKYIEKVFNDLISQLETYKLDLIESDKDNIQPSYEVPIFDKQQAVGFLSESNLLEDFQDLITNVGVIGNKKNRLILFLTHLSRKQEVCLHSVIQSPHNYLQSKIGELIPEEDKIEISHLSDNALFYFDEHELSNKVLLIEDVDNRNRKRLLPLFDLQTKGYFSKTTTQKDEFGQIKAVQRYIRGTGVVLSISTRQEEAFGNSEAYSFTLSEQTTDDNSMLEYQRKESAGKVDLYERQKTIELIKNLQRVIEPIRVINPFAEQLVLPKELLNPVYTNGHYLRFIEVITLFHQYQREKKVDETTGEEYIETTIEDIEKANELLLDILVNKSDKLNKPTRKYFESLKILIAIRPKDKRGFTNTEISMEMNIPIATVKRYHSTLLSNQCIEYQTDEENKQQGYRYVLASKTEQDVLKSKVEASLQEMMKSIDTGLKSTLVQKQNELSKTILHKDMEVVVQKEDEQESKLESGNSKKQVA